MIELVVSDISCGHCAGVITKAIKDKDAAADIKVDLGTKRVSVESRLKREEIAGAIEDAGYTVDAGT